MIERLNTNTYTHTKKSARAHVNNAWIETLAGAFRLMTSEDLGHLEPRRAAPIKAHFTSCGSCAEKAAPPCFASYRVKNRKVTRERSHVRYKILKKFSYNPKILRNCLTKVPALGIIFL